LKIPILLLSFLLVVGFSLAAPLTAQCSGEAYALPKDTTTYLKHNKVEAQKLFVKDCTKCHSEKTALSRRTYQDWLTGITYRHDKSEKWIPEEDAKKIFFHLIVHLEPELKQLVAGGNVVVEKNWLIILCTVSGILTLVLFFLVFSFANFKKLRKRWFKLHMRLAKITILIALFHGGLCFYLFVLK